jgi:hypothetical protein
LSWDYNSSSGVCDHSIVLERYVIDQFDFRTLHYAQNPALNMRAPINGQSLVEVWLRGVLVPPIQYSIILDTAFSSVGSPAVYKIVFNQPQRMTLPLVEVSYITVQETCLKCSGTGVLNDWKINPSGTLEKVRGRTKLAQQALKYILCSRNPFNKSLVCPIQSYVGKKFGLTVTDQDVSAAITTALTTYQSIQTTQKTVQYLTPEETLKEITGISARQDQDDPLRIYVALTITAFGQATPLALNLSIQGTNGGVNGPN